MKSLKNSRLPLKGHKLSIELPWIGLKTAEQASYLHGLLASQSVPHFAPWLVNLANSRLMVEGAKLAINGAPFNLLTSSP